MLNILKSWLVYNSFFYILQDDISLSYQSADSCNQLKAVPPPAPCAGPLCIKL